MTDESTPKPEEPSMNKPTAKPGRIDYLALNTPEFREALRKEAEDYPNQVARRRAMMRGEKLPSKPE